MTKVTLHWQRVLDWGRARLQELGAGWVKIVNPTRGSDPFPGLRKLIRFWTDNIDADYIRRGRQGGRDFVRRMWEEHWRHFADWGEVYFELANEPDSNTNEGLANLREYTVGAIEEANYLGIKLVILNLPEGNPHDNGTDNPDVTVWKVQQLMPAVRLAIQHGHLIGLHTYWCAPKAPESTDRWHALGRVAWTVEQAMGLSAAELDRIRVVVNEFGIDGGIVGKARQGWRNLSSAEAYSAGIVRAEQYARTKRYIETVALFTAGYEGEWGGFDHDEGIVRRIAAGIAALPTPAPAPAPTPAPVTHGIPMDGRFFSREEFDAIVQTLDLSGVRRVVIHHTGEPDEATWERWGGWEYWKHVLKRYYESKGWTKGPHLFVCEDGIGVFYDLTQDGRGVGGGAWEEGTRHIEIVGNFGDHVPSGERRKNAIAAAESLLSAANVPVLPETLTHHTAVVGRGVTACPGAMLIAHWDWFTELVRERWGVMDKALTEATAVRFEVEVIVRLLQEADQHESNIITERAMAERCRRQANMKLKALVDTKRGAAYRVEGLLGGGLPPDWEG